MEKLTKRYKVVEAVKGIDFHVEKGSLLAFLGTNGAGKSTTIEILCTIQEKTSGNVQIDGNMLGTHKGNESDGERMDDQRAPFDHRRDDDFGGVRHVRQRP